MLTTERLEEKWLTYDELASGQSVYNYYRDYDPTTGRYIQPDPIGLAGGVNPYVYANNNPLRFIDPEGLDVIVGLKSGSVAGAGHVGSSTTDAATFGFYPNPSLPFGPGSVHIDSGMDGLTRIPADKAHDAAFNRCLLKRMQSPGLYSLLGRNCKDLVVECLGEAGLSGSSYDALLPKDFFCKVAKKFGCKGEACDRCE